MRSKVMLAAGLAALVAGGVVFVILPGGDDSLGAGPLRIEPSSIHLAAGVGTQPLRLRNTGRDVASFEVLSDQPWIIIDPGSGTIAPGGTAIVVLTASRIGLPPGAATARLTVRSGASQAMVPVTVTVPVQPTVEPSGPARLVILSPHVSLGERTIAADALLLNQGAGRLRWKAAPTDPWLRVSPREGTIAGGTTASLRIVADRSGLAPGERSGSVAIASNGGDGAIAVSVVVGRVPLLEVSPVRLDFGLDNDGVKRLSFEVRNGGHARLTWRASVSKNFLTLPRATDGTLEPGARTGVEVAYDFERAIFGRRETAVSIVSNGGSGAVVVTGTTDPHAPEARTRSMADDHRHCSGGGCDRYMHAEAVVTEQFSAIVGVRAQWRICRVQGASAEPVCDEWRFTDMRRVSGDLFRGEIGPLPDCTAGLTATVPWRVYTKDSVGNVGAFPGTGAADGEGICQA